LEWGPIPVKTTTYEVKQYDDFYLTHAMEYEFNNTDDMSKFNSIINDYAKKNAEDANTDGLIIESWWQPFYSITNSDIIEEEYKEVYDVVALNGDLEMHTFTLMKTQTML